MHISYKISGPCHSLQSLRAQSEVCATCSLLITLSSYHDNPLAPPPFQKFNIITHCVTLLLLQRHFIRPISLFGCLILSFHLDIFLLLEDSPRFTHYLAAIFRLRHAEISVITGITRCHFQKILIAASPKSAHFWASNAQEFTMTLRAIEWQASVICNPSDCMEVICMKISSLTYMHAIHS